MKPKKIKITLKGIIYSAFLFFISIDVVVFCNMYFPLNKSYAKETVATQNDIKISNANEINLNEIIENNTSTEKIEKVVTYDEPLEYLTQYKVNKEIPKGVSYVVQEGRTGTQKITIKTKYDIDGNIISEEQIGTEIVKSSADKIVEIGGANYTSNYKVKKGDTVYVTSDMLSVWDEPSEESRKITTLKTEDDLKILDIQDSWYRISHKNIAGWVKNECTTYIAPNSAINQEENGASQKTKQQLLSTLNFNMNLNKPSGLSLEQFKKALSSPRDANKIFANNAEYFYYIEKQYNINGIFVAAVGIHESGWGTSKIATTKNNLFGYGAYDSNPYNGAYTFNSYSQSIDLMARIFVKYYLNPAGTSIYGGEKALGTYYNGPNLSGINKKYATDKNWANGVFTQMKFLYNNL